MDRFHKRVRRAAGEIGAAHAVSKEHVTHDAKIVAENRDVAWRMARRMDDLEIARSERDGFSFSEEESGVARAGRRDSHPACLNVHCFQQGEVFFMKAERGGEPIYEQCVFHHMVDMRVGVQDGGDAQLPELDLGDDRRAVERRIDHQSFAGIGDDVGIVIERAEVESQHFHTSVIPRQVRRFRAANLLC